MIKTLRITGIIVGVVAAVFVVFPSVFGVRSDKQIERFLSSAGAVEKFNAAKNDRAKDDEGRGSPLVKQAEAFALYLNPPPKPAEDKPQETPATGVPVVHRPATVSSKFTLIGTSYYALHPELSLALIDEPGKGLHWVRQGSKVGYLVIEEIKDSSVVVRDDKRTFELVAERPPKRSLVKGAGSIAAGAKTSPLGSGRTGSETTGRITQQLTAEGNNVMASAIPDGIASNTPPESMSPQENTIFDELVNKLNAVQLRVESGQMSEEAASAETAALMDKFVADFNSVKVGAEEAKKLDSLGKELKSGQKEPNAPPFIIDRARTLRKAGLSGRHRYSIPK
jgi:hypothetical protein